MPIERRLKKGEYAKFLQCHCRGVGPPAIAGGRIISKKPLKVESRIGGGPCTCYIYEKGKRKRPFRVGFASLVGGWK